MTTSKKEIITSLIIFVIAVAFMFIMVGVYNRKIDTVNRNYEAQWTNCERIVCANGDIYSTANQYQIQYFENIYGVTEIRIKNLQHSYLSGVVAVYPSHYVTIEGAEISE